jgi:hypothetical protein
LRATVRRQRTSRSCRGGWPATRPPLLRRLQHQHRRRARTRRHQSPSRKRRHGPMQRRPRSMGRPRLHQHLSRIWFSRWHFRQAVQLVRPFSVTASFAAVMLLGHPQRGMRSPSGLSAIRTAGVHRVWSISRSWHVGTVCIGGSRTNGRFPRGWSGQGGAQASGRLPIRRRLRNGGGRAGYASLLPRAQATGRSATTRG